MNLWLPLALLALSAVMMVLELRGTPVVLQLSFKGDIKRESLWLQQWGQFVATAAAMGFILSFKPNPAGVREIVAVAVTVLSGSFGCYGLKRICGRVRPNRENAGRFLGPTWKHANWRESFPSSHSACAFALSVSLSVLYPQATVVCWTLAGSTALLRYLMDAHWPADVLAGIACGYVLGHGVMAGFGYHGSI